MLADIFGSSPVQPLEKHIDLGFRAASQLENLFSAALDGDWGGVEDASERIEELEREAEALKKEIRLHMPRSLFMPVPRQDLLELLLVQDRIPDLARAVALTVRIRRPQFPDEIADAFTAFVERVIDATALARKSVRELDELFSAGFRGAEAKMVEGMIEDIARIEAETDNKQEELFARLVAIESTLPPVEAVFLYRIIEQVGEIADMAERTGRRLEVLLAR